MKISKKVRNNKIARSGPAEEWKRGREGEGDRETDRERERERQRERETERQRERDRERQREKPARSYDFSMAKMVENLICAIFLPKFEPPHFFSKIRLRYFSPLHIP